MTRGRDRHTLRAAAGGGSLRHAVLLLDFKNKNGIELLAGKSIPLRAHLAKKLGNRGPAVIRHLIVVAGPSGVGKTSFIVQLKTGQVAADLLACFPRGVEDFPTVKRRHFEITHDAKGSVRLRCDGNSLPERVSGLILDYTLNNRSKYARFDDDPSLLLLSIAQKVTLINLQAPAERLVEQWLHRQSTNEDHAEGRQGAGGFKRPFKRLLKRFSSFRLREYPVIKNYKTGLWLELLYGDWEDYIRRMVESGIRIDSIHLQPDPSAICGEIRWEQVARTC